MQTAASGAVSGLPISRLLFSLGQVLINAQTVKVDFRCKEVWLLSGIVCQRNLALTGLQQQAQ